MSIQRLVRIACVALLALWFLISASSHGDVIDFDSQGLFGPSTFGAAGPAQTISITTTVGVVTFQGGVIITAGTGNANTGSVYATGGPSLPNTNYYANPLIIMFPVPVANFSLTVGNGEGSTVTYLVADNDVHSQSNALPVFGVWQPLFAEIGSTVTVFSVPAVFIPPSPFPDPWDFCIDNITFEAIPEPSTLLLLIGGLAGLCFFRRRSSL